MTATGHWPSVGVIIPTRDRPELLRRAVAGIVAQDYPGPVRTIVIFDQHDPRSEEHTSELQSHVNLVCRLLLEKKKNKYSPSYNYTTETSVRHTSHRAAVSIV